MTRTNSPGLFPGEFFFVLTDGKLIIGNSKVYAKLGNGTVASLLTGGFIYLGEAPISAANDTTANWTALGSGWAWYPDSATITDKPSSWGILVTYCIGSDIFQLWSEQNDGPLYRRSGNAAGWGRTWTKIVDASSSTAPTNYAKISVGVFNGAGTPCTGVKLNGCGSPEPVVTNDGYAVVYVPTGEYNISVLNESTEFLDNRHGSVYVNAEAGRDYNVTLPLTTEYKILTTQNIKFSSAVKEVDVFCVGGGSGGNSSGRNQSGAGGGGGYTKTGINVAFSPNTEYTATIGAGGASCNNGGTTSLLGVEAAGGTFDTYFYARGGNGGSGGGAAGYHGGTDGSDGQGDVSGDYMKGSGQGTTTRPFGDTSAEPAYAAGGNGGRETTPPAKAANTGDGGDGPGGGWNNGGDGGSGIAIVRWRF